MRRTERDGLGRTARHPAQMMHFERKPLAKKRVLRKPFEVETVNFEPGRFVTGNSDGLGKRSVVQIGGERGVPRN